MSKKFNRLLDLSLSEKECNISLEESRFFLAKLSELYIFFPSIHWYSFYVF
jgi:hypothetical protein